MNVRLNYRSSLQVAALMLLTTLLAGCGINNIPTLDEQAKAAWGQVQNQYAPRRPDPQPGGNRQGLRQARRRHPDRRG